MKPRNILFLIFILGILPRVYSQALVFNTYTFNCEQINNPTESNFVQNYFLTNYADRFHSYEADLTANTAVINTNVEPIDVLQIYKHLGYDAFYLDNAVRYFLSPDGLTIREIKQ